MKKLVVSLLSLSVLISCNKNDEPSTPSNPNTGIEDDIPVVYEKIYGANSIYLEGDYVVIETNGLPDHKSPYYLGMEYIIFISPIKTPT